MSSAGHELMVDLLGKAPDALHELLGPRLDDHLASTTMKLRFHRSDITVSKIPPLGCDLCIELYDGDATTPFHALVIEVQLNRDEDKRYTWVAYQAGQYCRLRVPTHLVVITNDRALARWAAEPISSGQTRLTPIVLGPGDVPAITDPEERLRPFMRFGRIDQLRGCRWAVDAAERRPKGRVEIAFTIDLEGDAIDAEVVETTLDSERFGECMAETIEGWEFPRSTAGIVDVRATYVVAP